MRNTNAEGRYCRDTRKDVQTDRDTGGEAGGADRKVDLQDGKRRKRRGDGGGALNEKDDETNLQGKRQNDADAHILASVDQPLQQLLDN